MIRRWTLLLIAALTLSGCGGFVGAVNHSCAGNPARSQGSGCEDNGDNGA
jgi:hypothetical protein